MSVSPTRTRDDETLLRQLLNVLAARGIAKKWALSQNPIIQDTVETLISNMAMTANTNWQSMPEVVRYVARRGWHVSRWLPTFLIIDGPLGRFLKSSASPLNSLLKTEYQKYPTLAQVRDVFTHELFRKVRNGFGHRAFRWEDRRVDGSSVITMLDWETGNPTITISLLEAEALHFVSFTTISELNERLFVRVNPNRR